MRKCAHGLIVEYKMVSKRVTYQLNMSGPAKCVSITDGRMAWIKAMFPAIK